MMMRTLDGSSPSESMNFEEGVKSTRNFDEPRETPEKEMLINDTDMTLRPVKAV